MHFLEQQQVARRLSKIFIFQFVLVALLCLASVFLVTLVIVAPIVNMFALAAIMQWFPDSRFVAYLNDGWNAFVPVMVGSAVIYTILITSFGVWLRTGMLRKGHEFFDEVLRAQPVLPDTTDPEFKRLLNIRNEMSLAAGIPVPRLYVWPTNVAANSFTVGGSPADSSIFISRGALQALTRDELQVLVAYGFSQILNGDCALNTRTAAYIGAMRWPTRLTRAMVFMPFEATSKKFESFLIWIIFFLWLGLLLSLLTMPQYFAAQWLQKRIGHERQRLADATALQFTRDGYAYMNTLVKLSALNTRSERVKPILDDVAHACFIGLPGRRNPVEHRNVFDRIRALQASLTDVQICTMQREYLDKLKQREYEKMVERLDRKKKLARDPFAFSTPAEKLMGAIALAHAEQLLEEERRAAEEKRAQLNETARVSREREEKVELAADTARRSREQPFEAISDLRDAVAGYMTTLESFDPRVAVFSLLVDRKPEIRQLQVDYVRPRLGDQHVDALIRAIHSHKPLPPAERVAILEASLARLRDLPPQELRVLIELIRDLEQLDDYTDAFEYGTARMTEVYITDVLENRPAHGNRTLAHCASAVQVALSVMAQFSARQQARQAFEAGLKRIGMSRQFDYAPQLKWTAPLDRALKTLQSLMPLEKQTFLEGCRAIIDFDKAQSEAERELLRVIAIQLHCPMPRLERLEGIAA